MKNTPVNLSRSEHHADVRRRHRESMIRFTEPGLIAVSLTALAIVIGMYSASVIAEIPRVEAAQIQMSDQADRDACVQTVEVINGESYPHEVCK